MVPPWAEALDSRLGDTIHGGLGPVPSFGIDHTGIISNAYV